MQVTHINYASICRVIQVNPDHKDLWESLGLVVTLEMWDLKDKRGIG